MKLKQTQHVHNDPVHGLLDAVRLASTETATAARIAHECAGRAGAAIRTDMNNAAAMLESVARKLNDVCALVAKSQRGAAE